VDHSSVLTNTVRAMFYVYEAEVFITECLTEGTGSTQWADAVRAYEVLYGDKLNVSHLRAFGAPNAIVELRCALKTRRLGDNQCVVFSLSTSISEAVTAPGIQPIRRFMG